MSGTPFGNPIKEKNLGHQAAFFQLPKPLKLGFGFAETIPETSGINPKPMKYFLIQAEQKLPRL